MPLYGHLRTKPVIDDRKQRLYRCVLSKNDTDGNEINVWFMTATNGTNYPSENPNKDGLKNACPNDDSGFLDSLVPLFLGSLTPRFLDSSIP